jgi:hypothetical protein
MDVGELVKLYREATQVRDASVRDVLADAAARLGATQVALDAPAGPGNSPHSTEVSRVMAARARKEIVAAADAIARALKKPDANTASTVAAQAIAAEAIAAEAAAAEPFAAEPLAAEPFAAEPFAAEPLAAEPLAAEPLAAEPFAAEPFAAEPLAAEPFAAEPFAAEPMAAEPFAAEPFAATPFSSALQTFLASTGDDTGTTPGK